MASLLRSVVSTLAAALTCGVIFWPFQSLASGCTVPPESFLFEPTLPRLVASLAAGRAVTIVAIGSASTEGRAAGGPDQAWPNQFGQALKREFPAAPITVVNLGKARQTADDMVARFATEVKPLSPALVVWETGTVDAVRNVNLDAFRNTLQAGLDQLRPGIDVVLMDMQFSRLTHAMIDFEPYQGTLREIADVNDVPFFPRSDLMRVWSETGEIDYGVRDKEQRRAMAVQLYKCIGQAMAAFVARRPAAAESGR
jgi:lysophospholipase L1-like esterase